MSAKIPRHGTWRKYYFIHYSHFCIETCRIAEIKRKTNFRHRQKGKIEHNNIYTTNYKHNLHNINNLQTLLFENLHYLICNYP